MSESVASSGFFSTISLSSFVTIFSKRNSGSARSLFSSTSSSEPIKTNNFGKGNASSSPVRNATILHSLQNDGNTCYRNATIQVLAHCHRITYWIRRNSTRYMNFENTEGKIRFVCRMHRLLEDQLGDVQSMSGFRSRIKTVLTKSKNRRKKQKTTYTLPK